MKTIFDSETVANAVAAPVIREFDPTGRFWITAQDAGGYFSPVPFFEGTLVTDPALLAPFADDFGHLISRTPLAVLRAGSVDDVVKMVCFATHHGLRIASRGNAHTAFGQAQTDAGIIIDMSSVNRIHAITPGYAVVDAGVVWRDLLLATTAQQLTPPVLTDYTALTVGGTLSVGGVGGRSYRYGTQVDQVLELQVVTGEGELITCSASENSELFDAVLAGLGLCAIIVRATIRLIPARDRAQTHRLFYPDAPTMLTDLRLVTADERFDYVRGNGAPPPGEEPPTTFVFFIEATTFYTLPDELPDNPLADLHFIGGMEQVEDRTYFEFTDIVVQLFTALDAAGLGHLPHPWLDLLVADTRMDRFVSETIARLDPAQFLPGSLMLFYPLVTARLTHPLFRVPDEDQFFLFDILRTVPSDPAVIGNVLAENRHLYEQNRALGGTFYTISAVPMDAHDWQRHFGRVWHDLERVKRRYDPGNVLGAGLSVFG
ncbi:MAG: FAD-binding protein [Bacteroidetes bacterium]|nr:FAD-binding protein [Fibrella sp.]